MNNTINKKKLKNIEIMPVGLAAKMRHGMIAKALVDQEFTRCSGSFRGTDVHSLFSAEFDVNGTPLVAFADSADAGPKSQPVHVYATAELAVAVAAMGLSGATVNPMS